jgi:hypothetical protein
MRMAGCTMQAKTTHGQTSKAGWYAVVPGGTGQHHPVPYQFYTQADHGTRDASLRGVARCPCAGLWSHAQLGELMRREGNPKPRRVCRQSPSLTDARHDRRRTTALWANTQLRGIGARGRRPRSAGGAARLDRLKRFRPIIGSGPSTGSSISRTAHIFLASTARWVGPRSIRS